MRDLSPWYSARQAMVDALAADLAGTSADEHLSEPPLDRYIVGVLHPSGEPVEDALGDDDTGDETATETAYDPAVSLSRLRKPASMGLTFAVDGGRSPVVTVTVAADRYRPVNDGEIADIDSAVQALDESEDGPVEHVRERRQSKRPKNWCRNPAAGTFEIDTTTPAMTTERIADGLALRVVVRPPSDGIVSITTVLVDDFPLVEGTTDEWCWFRPSIVATVPIGAFVHRGGSAAGAEVDDDDRTSDLLYRHVENLAVGHGCAVTWNGESGTVAELRTTFFPFEELRIANPERKELRSLGMRTLAQATEWSLLHDLSTAYRRWIIRIESDSAALTGTHRETAHRHVVAARRAADRIDNGIRLVETNASAERAFRVMNEVMQEQRARQVMVRSGATEPSPEEHAWRPFQLAFVLLTIQGIVEPESEDRDVADVLWFPTGGGKTEAYLGLIAFTLVMRRLRSAPQDGAGVAVLMRYTLRLLTVQQFERAAGLICALETWRRRELSDSAPITLGLWVGQAATPNNVADAAAVLRDPGIETGDVEKGNPRQLLRCPWCGTPLPAAAYLADWRNDRLTITCPNVLCEFASGLPAFVVDSDVYGQRPSLLIGTVDKFAMLAWRAEAANLFGNGGTYDPPELIIQDELHLISGPLGTLVGLYETAVDAASTGDARPKLIASTATIRRAEDQVWAVFARAAEQFPPPGITSTDSFFAVDASPDERGTREYVGVCAPGTSHSTLLVRAYAALLQAGQDLDATPQVKDAYWTLLGYFTSLRVLGAAFIQSLDDVPDRMKVIAERLGSVQRQVSSSPPRELTSRIRSGKVVEELAILGTSYPDTNSPNVVLATNMISVGVDVDRLGLMVVMGQPQTTSEYIQATSRVGRLHPGLVVTLFNAARSRDLSHFESFTTYHRTLYRQVEATGATPFAARARDRGLHGLLVALSRLLIAGAGSDAGVGLPIRQTGALDRVRDVVRSRVQKVDSELEQDVMDQLEDLIDLWDEHADGLQTWGSWQARPGALIKPVGGAPGLSIDARDISFPVGEPSWATLTSLRNVDAESTLYLARRRPRRGA